MMTIGSTVRRPFGVAALGMVAVVLMAAPTQAEIDVAAVRAGLVLAEEPQEPVSLAAARQKLTATPQPVVIVGRIGGRGTEPFGRNEATFSMLEIPADDHAKKPGHKPDDCPFCKKRAANSPIAAVHFKGSDGKVIPLDARKLFGVAEGQDVVIKGTAFVDPKLGIPVIQVAGEGIFIRKPAE